MNYLYYQFWTKESLSCHIWNQNPWICLIAKYCEIMKMPKFGTKSALFGYFWARILKNYCHIWNQHLRICLIAKFCEETKMPEFGTKNALFGCFWARIFKKYCHIWNQHLWISVIAKFCEEKKMPKFGTKNTNFEYFWPKMPYLGVFGQEIKKKTIVIFEISTLEFVELQNIVK